MQPLKKPRKRLRPGDLLAITSEQGIAIIHYVGRNPSYGHAIYVYPQWHKTRDEAMCAVLSGGYLTYYPAQSAVLQGLAEIVATEPLPRAATIPTRFRRPGASDRQGNVFAWIIMEPDGTEQLKRKLSLKDRELPIAAVWNHEYLIDRINEGWKPEHEG